MIGQYYAARGLDESGGLTTTQIGDLRLDGCATSA
jgi:hypothetical protein